MTNKQTEESTVAAILANASADGRAASFTSYWERCAIKRLAAQGLAVIVSEGPSGYEVPGHNTEILALPVEGV
jgi:hypothetical protein